MANQENGEVKQLKLRVPMELYVQLEIDAAAHNEPPATRARHILGDQLMCIPLSAAAKQRVKELVAANWAKIRKESNK